MSTLSKFLRRAGHRLLGRDPRRDLPLPPEAAAFAREVGVDPLDLAGVILKVDELRPIVEAIRARPDGSLLVFGCGNDSVFWEKVNRPGRTAFLEDDPAWADATRRRLREARIHPVRYGTRRQDWRELLEDERWLAMELPEEVAAAHWDVILVDAPAGFDDTTPGRMKSIYAASRLARPGTRVFLHDCERAVEAAYAARYLGQERMYVEIRGRAILRGYSF